MIVHRKDVKKQNSKIKKTLFSRKSTSENPFSKLVSMGYAGEILKCKTQK